MRRWILSAALIALAAEGSSCGDDTTVTPASPARIQSTVPSDGASHVAVDTSVRIEFEGPVHGEAIPDSAFTINGLPLAIEAVEGNTLVLRPLAPLPYNRICTVRVSAGVWTTAQGGPGADYVWSFSTDPGPPGVTWSRENSGTDADLTSVTGAGNGYVVVGKGGTVLESESGLTWRANSFNTPQSDLVGVFALGNVFLVARDGGLYVSSPGGHWEDWDPGVAGFHPRAVAQSNSATESAIVLVGVSGTDEETGMVVRWDGTEAQTFTAQGGPLDDVAWSSYYGRYFAVGASGSVLHSIDGRSWMEAPMSPTVTSHSYASVTVRSGYNGMSALVVAVGDGIICSADGHSAWTSCVAAPPSPLHDVIWAGDRFVAVGDDGLILESKDGHDWAIVESGTQVPLRGVSTTGSTLVAVGDGGTILRSPASRPQ